MQNIVTQSHCEPVVWSTEHRSQIYDPMKVNTVSGYLTRSNIASLLTVQTSTDHIHPRYTYKEYQYCAEYCRQQDLHE